VSVARSSHLCAWTSRCALRRGHDGMCLTEAGTELDPELERRRGGGRLDVGGSRCSRCGSCLHGRSECLANIGKPPGHDHACELLDATHDWACCDCAEIASVAVPCVSCVAVAHSARACEGCRLELLRREGKPL